MNVLKLQRILPKYQFVQQIFRYLNDMKKLILSEYRKVKFTPLYKAAKNGHYEVCQLIISNVNEKNPASHDGFTPLHFATKHGQYKICNLIGKNLRK